LTLQDLGNLGELFAAVGVIISLVYLAVQLRGNTLALRSESRDKNFADYVTMGRPTLIDKELMRVWFSGLDGAEELDREDSARFTQMLFERFIYASLAYMRGVEIGDPQGERIARRVVTPLLDSPAAVAQFLEFPARPEFKKLVDTMIAEKESNAV
jgi:hypothetical protein